MDLTSQKTIKSILQAQGTRPRRGLGQNFLTSKGALGDILKAAALKKSDTVLEIGSGIGTLTRELALAVKKVIAVEKDPAMVEILKKTTKDLKNVEIIQGDILRLGRLGETKEFLGLAKEAYKVVANLPYYITSPVIRLFLETENMPELMVLMVQKEVAQRICAKPPKMTLLAVSVQFYAEPSIVSYVKKNCFWPQPKVDSAILKITPHTITQKSTIVHFYVKVFWDIVRAGFRQPRKQLLNNLVQGLGKQRSEITLWLEKHGIQGTRRAETLTLQDWIKLAKDYTIGK